MIFDSPRIKALVTQYASELDTRVPHVVFVARSDELTGEREHTEALVAKAPEQKQRDWLGRLTSTDMNQYLGAWFEVKLFGWLKQVGETVVEPTVEGDSPDFSVMLGDRRASVEAHAVCETAAGRERHRGESEVIWALRQIQETYAVFVKKIEWCGQLDLNRFASEVRHWLQSAPDVPLDYVDASGTRTRLEAQRAPTLQRVGVGGPVTVTWVNPEPLRSPLREKAAQHRRLRKAGHPHILALYLESWKWSAEEVAEAWFGKSLVLVDAETSQVISEKIDRSGIQFYGPEVRYTTVSGTLVFRSHWLGPPEPIRLSTWYIENPYAAVPVDPSRFPVQSRFVVVNKDVTSTSMAWRRTQPD